MNTTGASCQLFDCKNQFYLGQDGLQLVRLPPDPDRSEGMIMYSPSTPLYVHQWKIPLLVISDMTTTKATLKMPPQENFMKLSIALPMSPVFEKAFLKDLNDVLITTVFFFCLTLILSFLLLSQNTSHSLSVCQQVAIPTFL